MQLAPDLDLWASLPTQRAGLSEQPPVRSSLRAEGRRPGVGHVLCPSLHSCPLLPTRPAGPLTSVFIGETDDPDGAQPRLWGWKDTQGSRCPCEHFRLSSEPFATDEVPERALGMCHGGL